MSKTLFNVTQLLVEKETETLLYEQPYKVREEFVRNDLYQDLLAYVLTRVQNVYRAIDEKEKLAINSYLNMDSARRKLDREKVIVQGIYRCLEKSEKRFEAKFAKTPTPMLVRMSN